MRFLNRRPNAKEFLLKDVKVYFDLETRTIRHVRKSELEEWIKKSNGRFGFAKYPLINDMNSTMHGDVKFNNIRYTFDIFYPRKSVDLDISSILNGIAFSVDEQLVLSWRYRAKPHPEVLNKIMEFGYLELGK